MPEDSRANCQFCLIAYGCERPQKKILAASREFLAFPDIYPINPGHLLVIPKRHETSFSKLLQNPEMAKDLSLILERTFNYLKVEFSPDGYNIGWNDGESAGQTIMHAHLHIIPRYQNDTLLPSGGIRNSKLPRQIYKQSPR